jgi:ribonuclease HII
MRFDQRIRRARGIGWLMGVDEAGRGSLAGPVLVAAAVVPDGVRISGIRDSKLLSRAARESAFRRIREGGVHWSALAVAAADVDRRNVLAASLWGMERVSHRLACRLGSPPLVLIDGNRVPEDLPGPGQALVGGDDRSLAIAVASVIAKVLRDRVMAKWDRHFPGYGFARHVGYPTPEHLRALRRLGPCALHRRSFAPVAATRTQLPLLADPQHDGS